MTVVVSVMNVVVSGVGVSISIITVNDTTVVTVPVVTVPVVTVPVVPVHVADIASTVAVDEPVIAVDDVPSTACIRNLRYTGSAQVEDILEVVLIAVVVLPVVSGEFVVEAVEVVLDGGVGPPKHPLAVVVGLPDVGVGNGEL